MPYLKLTITTNPDKAEILSDHLTELGALSVSMQDAEDEPIFQLEPGQEPLWQRIKLDALFEDGTSIDTIIKALKTENSDFTDVEFYAEKIEDQDWVRITQQHFQPKQYGKNLWICPAWHDAETLEGTVVKIDPGLAFGTGTHPTTSLCLEWLSNHPPKNMDVIDYGCGSGILALSALALGANKVWAIDHDPQALTSTHLNAELNGFNENEKLETLYPKQCKNISAPVVVANILANPLIELAPKLIGLVEPAGHLILSGLLEKEIDRVSEAYTSHLKPVETKVEDGWSLISLSSAMPG